MKKLHFSFNTELVFSSPVTAHNFILRCIPSASDVQTILNSQISISPACELYEQKDGFGNTMLCGSILSEHTNLAYSVSGEALVDRSKQGICPAHPMYRFPGRLTRATASLDEFFKSLTLNDSDSLRTALEICHSVHNHFRYVPGSTNVSFSAADSFEAGSGVCQDYAHVMITLCRMAGIPARYCAGLTIGEGSTHAWVEVSVNSRWVGIDPTRNQMVDDTYLTLTVGRDFADCAIERGLFRGNANQMQSVFACASEQ